MEKEILDGIKEVGANVTKIKEDTAQSLTEVKTAVEDVKTKTAEQLAKVTDSMNEFEKKLAEQKEWADKFEAAQAKANQNQARQKSFNEILAEEVEKNTDNFAKLERREKGAKVEIEISRKAVGGVTTANVTGGTVWGSAGYRPSIVEIPQAMRHMTDIISVLPAGPGTDYYYMRENGPGEGAPAPTAEGATKPQFDIDLIEDKAPFETIAGWMSITRKALNNIPGLVSFIQKRAMTKLKDAEDTQILYGDGVSPNLKGILTSGNFVASTSASTVLVEKILDDLATLEDTHKRYANGILLRPIQYWSFFKNKATGSGEYDLPMGVNIVGDQLYLWGVPVVKMPALNTNAGSPTTNDYVVGDFENGADLMLQEAIRLEFFDQDVDNVRKNLITMRIEETAALPVYGNNFFIKGTV